MSFDFFKDTVSEDISRHWYSTTNKSSNNTAEVKYIPGVVFTNPMAFNSCNTKEEVKRLFRKLAKAAHPDRGGDTRSMQNINDLYKLAIKKVERGVVVSRSTKFSDTFGW